MKIDTEGTYTLRYTAEDECGNVTTEDRTVNVINITYSTVLFTDGTFIINEKSTDRAANIALHGAVTHEYAPFNPNGRTNIEKYIFSSSSERLWYNECALVTSVEIGSDISPTSMRFWFESFTSLEEIIFDSTSKLHTDQVTSMGYLFDYCSSLKRIDLSGFNTENVTDMTGMFLSCMSVEYIDISSFDTKNVTQMVDMFSYFGTVALDLRHFDTSKVTSMRSMFYGGRTETILMDGWDTSRVANFREMFDSNRAIKTLDLSSFDTSASTTFYRMFRNCSYLTTIYASNAFVIPAGASGNQMFVSVTRLVGGAGTSYNASNPTDATYAHIDGGTSNPGYFTAKS